MVAKNHCLMKLRDRQGRNAGSLNEESLLIEEVSVSYQQHLDKDRMLDTMTATLQELNGEQKQCVTLFYLDKKSYQEIAEHTGFSMLQVKSHIQNGKRNLRLLIERRLSSK